MSPPSWRTPRSTSLFVIAIASLGVLAGKRASATAPLEIAKSGAPAASSASARYSPLVVTLPPLRDRGAAVTPTESNRYFTDYRAVRTPVVRLAIGPGVRVNGPGENAFLFDAVVGARLGLHPGRRQWGLFPEGGYSFNKANHEHAWTLGMGLGFGELPYWGYVALMPRLVGRPGHGIGWRLGLAGQVTETGLSLELAAQRLPLDPGGSSTTDLRFTIGLDVFLLGSVVSGNHEWKWLARP